MECISEGIFEKYSKMKILVFEIFEKGQILSPFPGLAPSKEESEESKGGTEKSVVMRGLIVIGQFVPNNIFSCAIFSLYWIHY